MGPLLHAGLRSAALRWPDRAALRCDDRSWSFRDLDLASEGFAGLLAGRGARAGDRIAVMVSNRPEFLVVVSALSRLGAAAVLLSPAWKRTEVTHALAVTGAVHGVADGASVALLRGLLGPVIDLDNVPPSTGEVTHPSAPSVGDDDRDAVLVFSSGTTGLPKAVRHTHASLGAATAHWVAALGLGPEDRFQVATPPSHILGLLNLLAAVEAGATVRQHARFDLDGQLRCIETERMTLEMAVAPIAQALAGHSALEQHDLSSLRYIMWGATPVTAAVAECVTARTGVRWLPAYGASELPVLACNPVGSPDAWRLDSVGLAPPGVELRVVDLETGSVLGPGQVGEIQARSASVMAGYLPEDATADAFADGWYRTGDVGWLEPDGWVHLTDRAKEFIKVSGFQVAPAEVEGVLLSHPAVRDCAVFGVPDERTGEAPLAAVQLGSGQVLATGELEALVAAELAAYKRVREVLFVESIPRLPSGKVLRRELRAQWGARVGSHTGSAVGN